MSAGVAATRSAAPEPIADPIVGERVELHERYRRNVVEPICELVRFIGREIDKRDLQTWFSRLAIPARQRLVSAEIYDYVEIMP